VGLRNSCVAIRGWTRCYWRGGQSLLRGEVVSWIGALARGPAAGAQLGARPFGERVGIHRVEGLVGAAQLVPVLAAALLSAQPFAAEQLGARRAVTRSVRSTVGAMTRVGSFSAQRTPDCEAGGSCRGSQAGAARFPGVLLPRGPLQACSYRSGSADAARSRATDPAMTRAHPAAILGLRRCTARATQGT
jgi:hypothetical protein